MSLPALARRLVHASGKLDTTRPYITMWDDIIVANMPAGGSYAYAGYVDGLWPTYVTLLRKFPGQRVLSVAVFASDDAECLDIERGDATVDQAPRWFARQVAQGVWRPVLYVQASNMKALEQVMSAHHIPRADYRLWIAHYTGKPHLCAPGACGYGLSEADGCQWTDRAFGISLDRSLLVPDFFDSRPAPVKPVPTPQPPADNWQEAMMNRLPTLKQDDQDTGIAWVGRMQALVKLIGERNHLEKAAAQHTNGVFDDMTKEALAEVQKFFKLAEDGICGPKTWSALVTAEP